MLRVVVTFIDDGGATETVSSAPTEPVVDNLSSTAPTPPTPSPVTPAGQIWGLGGGDTLIGLARQRPIVGGLGNDPLNGGTGNDTMWTARAATTPTSSTVPPTR